MKYFCIPLNSLKLRARFTVITHIHHSFQNNYHCPNSQSSGHSSPRGPSVLARFPANKRTAALAWCWLMCSLTNTLALALPPST